MSTNSKWKNTFASLIMMSIISIICVNLFYFRYFDYSQDYTLIIWPIGISIALIFLFFRMANTLKYRLQKKFVNKTSLQISESISNSLNRLNLPFSIKHNTRIASNPEIISDTLFIIDTLGISIGQVPFKKGTGVFIMYNKDTTKNELIKICKEIDDTINTQMKLDL